MYLYGNSLTGTIPSEIGLISGLSTFHPWLIRYKPTLSLHRLTRLLSFFFSVLCATGILSLQSNDLAGTIPLEIGALAELGKLWLV